MSAETPERLDVQTPADAITALLHEMVKAIVLHPDQVVVYWRSDNGRVLIDVEVAPQDEGRLIGRNGQRAYAIRTILDAVASVQPGIQYRLKLQRSKEAR